ncbi:aspartate dehydrogenase, partial [candidate division MSBL1 archaeon SCGC-AAA261C02]
LEDKEIDLVVEAASQEAVSEYAIGILESGKDLMVLSIGAFSDEGLFREVSETARDVGQRVYLPSGAILGLDGLKAVKIAGIDEVSLTTRKPPETLAATKFVKEKKIELSNLKEPKVIFEGSAREAVEAFPKSVNVAATLSLVTSGFDQTKVKVVADPSTDRNIHEIRVKGEAGEFTTRACNVSSPDNPKTSYLAALSAIQELRDLTGAVTIGT